MSEARQEDYQSNVVPIREDLGALPSESAGALKSSGGGGTFDDMTWQDAVQRVDDKVDDNFKWVIGIFGAGFMVLLAAFASAFLILSGDIRSGNEKLAVKLDTISTQIGDVKTDVAVLKTQTAKRP